MSLTRVHRTLPRLKSSLIKYSTQPAPRDDKEYTSTPNYPPILDLSLQARKKREREKVYENIKNLKTVEEKQIALNMPRYYGWKSVLLHENRVPFNAMPLIRFYTRSHFIPIEKLPENYSELEPAAALIIQEIKQHIEEALITEHEGIEYEFTFSTSEREIVQKEDALSKCIVKQINRIIMNNLAAKLPHILPAQVDYDPIHEGFWFVGGVDTPRSVVRWRKQYPWIKERWYDPIDRPVQYLGSPILTVRSDLPLKPLLAYEQAENPAHAVPKLTHHPESAGYYTELRHGTNKPGFWPGDSDEFGLISYHGRGHILARKESFGPEDDIEALHCQGMSASFGWLIGQASYQGFTAYNDMTYPLTTQTVITNGQLWSFYLYQLNTISMHNDKVDENPKNNVCFGTRPLKLYDGIENGKVIGLNEDVLKMIVQLYLNAPQKRDHAMSPYLGGDVKLVADIEHDKMRCWYEKTYKHVMSNRSRHRLLPEIYHWEWIYKIKFNTRFHEAKRRPFEHNINPFNRRLDEHQPQYIPKALRSFPKSKKKWEKTYYPKI